jgi:hypothetical protein
MSPVLNVEYAFISTWGFKRANHGKNVDMHVHNLRGFDLQFSIKTAGALGYTWIKFLKVIGGT